MQSHIVNVCLRQKAGARPFGHRNSWEIKMLARIGLAIALVAGAFIGINTVAVEKADARYFNPGTGQWQDEPLVKRRLDQRKVPSKFKRRIVGIQTTQAPGTIIIDTDKKFLYYIKNATQAIRYGVGVGREGFGWNGEVTVRRKVEWPAWHPPAEMRERERAQGRELPVRMEGGEDNPLGARALYLFKGNQDTLYRIHGTNQPWSIGLNLSSGCFRMMNKDVEHLYELADIGTKVIVVGPGESSARYLQDRGINPFAGLFNVSQ